MEIIKMQFKDRLKALRIRASMTQKELSEKLGVSVVSVQNWELGNKRPSMAAIIALAQLFCVTTDYLLGVTLNPVMDYLLLTSSEKSLLNNYRTLDYHGQQAVDAICRIEKQRIDSINKTEISSRKPRRYIPKYLMASAAGYAVPLEENDFEMMPAGEDVPYDADFAVCIQGNSMLPYIHDGDVVYAKRTSELVVGDIGIFSVDGSMYCKQYYLDEAGNLTLVSTNPRFKNANVFVRFDSETDVRCCGKVLLGYNVPLPEYIID